MGKINQTIINSFSGGISNDLRSGVSNKFAITEHFDTHSYPHKLKPYRSHIADESQSGAKLGLVRKMTPGQRTSSQTAVLWGLGQSGSVPAIFYHDSTPETDDWSTPANNTAAGNVDFSFFFYYKDGLFGFQTNKAVFRYDTSAATMNSTSVTFTNSLTCQPVHHPADDMAYFFDGNLVRKLDGTSWAAGVVLTLPTNMTIVSACPYGNYLAIACRPKGSLFYGVPNVVFLWDRDSSLTTLSHRIDFGVGNLQHIASLDNRLVAVVDRWINAPTDAGVSELVILGADSSTSSATVLNRIPSVGGTNPISTQQPNNVVADNIMYFPYRITNGVVTASSSNIRDGIWSVNSRGEITLEVVEQDLASASSAIDGIARMGGYWFIAHSGDGSIQRTDDGSASTAYTYTSIYESLIFNDGDSSAVKQLLGATVTTEPLPTAGQIVLKYRKDAETAWTTIYTNTTDSTIFYSANRAGTSHLPEFKEIQFRIESTGGAEITSLKFKSEFIDKDLY